MLYEWDTALILLDDREDYGEERHIGLGFVGDRLHCLVYTIRGEARRVISLRKAKKRELDFYEQAQA